MWLNVTYFLKEYQHKSLCMYMFIYNYKTRFPTIWTNSDVFLFFLFYKFIYYLGPSFVTSLEPLAHLRNVASLSLFYRYHFGRCSSELARLVPLTFSWGRSICYSDRLHDFSVTIPRCFMSTVSFLTQLGSGILCL